VNRIVLATATVAAVLAAVSAATAGAAGQALTPHVYVARISGAPVAQLNGTWRLSLLPNAFTLARNGASAVAGTLIVKGTRVTFRDTAGALACRGAQIAGVYGWRLRGSTLTLTRFSDRCVGRRTVLAHAFTRVA
jgi:hypothetical protein